jgi:hypothetical protein
MGSITLVSGLATVQEFSPYLGRKSIGE